MVAQHPWSSGHWVREQLFVVRIVDLTLVCIKTHNEMILRKIRTQTAAPRTSRHLPCGRETLGMVGMVTLGVSMTAYSLSPYLPQG